VPGAVFAIAIAFAAFLFVNPEPSNAAMPGIPSSSAAAPSADVAVPDAPGRGLGLSQTSVPDPQRSPIRIPLAPAGGAGIGGAVLAGSVLVRRRRGAGSTNLRDPIFVYVPGHGGDPQGFDDLAGMIGLNPQDVRVFDYRWAWPTGDPIEASQRATTDEAADALGAYLAALGADGRPIYVVGHSKGGAVITEVVSRWDAVPEIGVDAVVGATILDPPISGGALGLFQSLGWFHGDTADDGLFAPVRCGWTACRDVRDGLGERSGVEVVIVRNPDAGFTSFRDRPEGVRVYDFDDDGGSMLSRFPNVIGMWRRMGEAHNSVLHSEIVADCIAAEAGSVGSCSWPSSHGGRMSGGGKRRR
jgi:hypothetical protein